MKFQGKHKVEPGIPMSSLPDIVFLLLIFFMVSSVFKEFNGLQVKLPLAKKIEKLQGKRDVSYLWVSKDGAISADDKLVNLSQLTSLMDKKRRDPQHPLKVVSMKIDVGTTMKRVTEVHTALREANALYVNYSAKPDF